MKKLSIALFAITLATNSYAQTPETFLCNNGYSVFFGNGVNTEPTGAYNSTVRIKAMLGESYDNEPISYAASYNPTETILSDLLEAFAQKRAEDPTLSWQLFFRWVSGRFITSSLQIALEDFMGIDGSQRIAQVATRLSSPQAFTDQTVVGHASTYFSAMLAGKRVMLVSHSQGNLYANAIYSRLSNINSNDFDIDAFGIAAVASPANFVASGDNHVTSDTDHLIDAVRIVAPATLASNDNSVPFLTSADYLGHGFLEIYTNSQFGIRNHTQNVMNSTLDRISQVTPRFSGGPITATLTWSSPGDIDLHTYDPSSHVYYANTQSSIGHLDRDDTTGTGPEHYFAACNNFQAGNYSFGVNYYSGSGSKQATIKLSVLGVDYPSRTVTVTTPRFSSGDNSPTILYRVLIEDTNNGSYSATVQ